MLQVLHPKVAAIDCRKCAKFAVDLKTGEFFRQGELMIPRGPEGPPCRQDKKICPKGEPGKSDLTKQNQKVLEHYRECRAVGEFPDDDLVRLNARILDQVFDDCEAVKRRRESARDIRQILSTVLNSRTP